MAGIFKSLDQADIRITPFRTYKMWADVIISGSNNISGSVYTIYKADHNPLSNHTYPEPLKNTFDLGNARYTANEPSTSNGQYQRVVHRSINHLYYRSFYTNNKASFGSGNTNKQDRYLEDKAWVISMPQSKFGQSILPGSISILITGSFLIQSGSLYNSAVTTCVTNSLTIIDDSFGNLIVSGSDYYSPYGQYIGGAYTNYTSSITKRLAGQWPDDTLYLYSGTNNAKFSSSFNKGMWRMDTIYNNINVTTLTGSTIYPSDLDLLGTVMHFTSSNSSSVEIKGEVTPIYNDYYNFDNGDFAISMMVRPTQFPTHPSGSILLNKQGLEESLKVDANGNVYSVKAPNKTPYRLSYTTGSCKLKFERGRDGNPFALTSSISMSLNTLYHIAAVKSGSLVFLYVNSADSGSSINSGSVSIPTIDCANKSNIMIGNNYTLDQGFSGVIDNIKMYKDPLSQNDINIMHHTLGVGNLLAGNAFYNHGIMTLTSIPTRFTNVMTVEARGTHTIYENEISCTINAGDFAMSSNPTLQEYDYEGNEFVYRSFVTGSYFKPYITTIGLYDDNNRLLVVGKLNTPIQTSNNTDTTFIVKYDK